MRRVFRVVTLPRLKQLKQLPQKRKEKEVLILFFFSKRSSTIDGVCHENQRKVESINTRNTREVLSLIGEGTLAKYTEA